MQRRVVFVVFDGFQLLDLAGPADVFAAANLVARTAAYRIEVTAASVGPVVANTGIAVEVTEAIPDVVGDIDTLVVVGGLSVPGQLPDSAFTGHIARLSALARRTASVCNGALLLAEAGLLAGRRATTHWLAAADLARYPNVSVDADRIYQRDGAVWTSAGVTAGIDLALALVADDHGHRVARDVARGLVVYLHRPGGQSQFSPAMRARGVAPDESMRELLAYIDANPGADLSVPALARRAGLSERHFARVFAERTGLPPGRYVERSRAEAARRLLETTDHPLERIARDTGIGAPETLFRVFRRLWRVAPGEYRRRFATR
jgi:transcriptional regulator GlxA family with amidase domain